MSVLYAARGGSSASDLYTVNPATGAMTSVGATGYAITGLAVDPSDGTLYAVTSNSSPIHVRALITLNPSTGAATFVGSLGLSIPISDIAFKSDGTLYGVSNATGFYTINKTTGAASTVDGGGPGGLGNGFEIDAANNGYVFPNGLGDFFDEVYDLGVGIDSMLVIGTIGTAGGAFGNNPVAGASFDASGVLWIAISDSSSPGSFATVATDGTITVVGSIGSALGNLDALAWQGSVKPNPWFVPVELLTELYDTTPISDAIDYSTPNPNVSTDGAAQGPSALKVDAAAQDSWVEFNLPSLPTDFEWIYTSFALYVPAWSDLWDSGTAWTPSLMSLETGFGAGANPLFEIVPTSGSTGVIRFPGPADFDSPSVPDGQWVAVEAAYVRKTGAFNNPAVRFWVNGIDGGQHTFSSAWSAVTGILVGDGDRGGPPPTDANVRYYIDDFHIAFQRIGPVDLSGAFFNGVGSGIDTPAGSAAGPSGPTGPPATTGYAPTFTVTNLAHDGSEISTLDPIGGTLKWTYRLAQSGGPGDGEWAVALSDASLTDADQFAPYRTDWKITMHYPGEPDEDLIAGILGPINLGSEPSGVFGQVRVTGKDWLHWLEQPYPFDYPAVVADVVTNQLLDPSNLFKQWIGQSQETIVGDLLTALDGNVGAVVFAPSYEGTGWSLTLDKEVAFGDNTALLDLVLDIAKLATVNTDQYGFDMWCDPDKTVHLVAPRVTDPAAVVPVFTLDDANVVAPPLDWTNNGPLETDSVVFGQANNNTARIGFSDYPASQTVYRQWTQFQQVSLADADAISAAAAGIGLQDRFPQKNLKITIRPDLLDPLDPRVGFRSQLGQGILVHYPVNPYHTIFADFYIVEQSYYTPDGCNWLCDLTLQQIYTADANPDTS